VDTVDKVVLQVLLLVCLIHNLFFLKGPDVALFPLDGSLECKDFRVRFDVDFVVVSFYPLYHFWNLTA
jgi:hypothetical protein